MALFPSNPNNGDTTVVNGITYTYNSAQTAWIRTSTTPPGDLNVSGNLTATGNISGVRLISNVATGTAPLTVTSTTVVANLNADLLDGYNSAVANTANTVAVRDASGNLAANFFIGNGSQLTGIITSVSNVSNGNSNLNIPAANGNINLSVAGNANVLVVTGTGVNVAGTLNATGNANVGNLGATGVVATTLGGSLTTAAQPNITSVSTSFSGLTFVANAQITMSGAGSQISGVNLVSANSFSGNGSSITGINATSIASGTLAQARLANSTLTLGNTTLTLGDTTTTIAGLTNITSTQLTSNVATGTAPLVVTSTTQVANLNVATAGSATTAGTVTTAAQPNITSVGTLSSLAVTGNLSSGNANLGNAATANFFIGSGNNLSNIQGANVTGAVAFASTANAVAGANVSGQVGNALVAGTVYTAAQPNITSVGTLTSLGVNGTVTAVAFTANTGVFTGNAAGLTNIPGANVTGTVSAATTAGTVTTAAQPNITSVGTLSALSVTGNVAAGNLTTTGVLSVTGTGVSSIAGNLDMTGNTIINLATPTNPTDAATKQYVDDVAQGLNIHDSVQAATSTTLATTTGGTITYNNGSSGVGANLVTTGTFNLIDGVNVQTAGTRILVKNEANAVHNGIYTWSNATVITRATDYDTVPEVEAGDFVFVTGGTLYDNTGWVQTSTVTAIGTAGNTIDFTQFSGAGTYQAGTGLTLTGSTFSVNASQTQITSVGTLTGLNSSGTITAPAFTANTGVFTGNGSGLSAIAGGNVTGTVASATSATTAGTVTTAAQPNITSVGTLTSLGVSGTITAPAFTANTGIFTGNGSGLSAIAGANVTGTVANATFATSAGTAGTVTTAAQPNITSVGTLTSLSVTGTTTSGNLTTAGILTVTGNTALSGANVSLGAVGNIRITGGTANQVLRSDGASGAVSWQTLPVTNIQEFTATGGQTTFTVTGTYIVGSVLVFVNGIQMNSVDYTASNGTTVVLTEARVAGDTVRVVSSVGSVGLNNLQSLSVAMSVALGM